MVAGSNPDEDTEFFFPPIYLILPTALGPVVDSASNRNEYQGGKTRPVSKADNLNGLLDACNL
jgi:hypothetical protein